MTNDQVWKLIARKLAGEATQDELTALDGHLKNDPELAAKVELYSFYFQQPQALRKNNDGKHRAWENLRQKLEEQFPERNWDNSAAPRTRKPFVFTYAQHGRWLSIAASILLVAVSAIYYTGWSRKDDLAGVPSERKRENIVVQTERGKRLKKVLPDGTSVWLNGESRLTYNSDFGKQKREIVLTGEAFFDVAHNASVPLTVHAKGVNILVKGTAFNVKSYPQSDKVETSLIHGSVELTDLSRPNHKIQLKPNEKITIAVDGPETALNSVASENVKGRTPKVTPHYRIEALKESSLAKVIPEVSWVNNVLVFDNEPFEKVIDKMEKWYNVDIQISEPGLRQRKFSGVFNNEGVVEALQALQIIIPFHFEQNGRTIIIK
ncbi:FecR family protein [Dyadobacter sp. OTU695]|uniref:FecR family protein n=1 Tax=Dyadobacter sp. OTU695 TaxID=3043860 RepID=UPI00313AFA0A